MAYLDSNGNVSDLTVQNWAYFTREQGVLRRTENVAPIAPTSAVPAGSEKAIKGTH